MEEMLLLELAGSITGTYLNEDRVSVSDPDLKGNRVFTKTSDTAVQFEVEYHVASANSERLKTLNKSNKTFDVTVDQPFIDENGADAIKNMSGQSCSITSIGGQAIGDDADATQSFTITCGTGEV